MANFSSQYGPYPEEWGPEQIRFFNSESGTFRELYESQEEWEDVQDAFGRGWLFFKDPTRDDGHRLTKSEHEEARQEFFQLSGMSESSFDWEGYREYLEQVDTGSI